MDRYSILKNAEEKTDPYATKVGMVITTLDPDYPYPLHFEITLDIPDFDAMDGHSQGFVFDFLINFNELLLGVDITKQEIYEKK